MQILFDPGLDFKKMLFFPPWSPQPHPPLLQSTLCRANEIWLEIWITVSCAQWRWKSLAGSSGITSEMMNGHACLSRWAGGATVWMGACRRSTLSYPRCGSRQSRLTALIMDTLSMSDLGRQQKYPYLCAHARTHRENIFFHSENHSSALTVYSHCQPVLSWLPPIGSCHIANWALLLMTQHTDILTSFILMPLKMLTQFIMHTHTSTLNDSFSVYTHNTDG